MSEDRVFPLRPEQIDIKRTPKYAAPGCENQVRLYKYSPERILLQIRGSKQFASVTLDKSTVLAIADALHDEAKNIRGSILTFD